MASDTCNDNRIISRGVYPFPDYWLSAEAAPPLDYYTLLRKLQAIGNNLNQLPAKANSTGHIDAAVFQHESSHLRRAVLEIQAAFTTPDRRTELGDNSDLGCERSLKGCVETCMRASVMTATGNDNPIDPEEQGDLKYRKAQLEKLQNDVVDIEEMQSGISIMDLEINEFRLDLLIMSRNMVI